MWRKLTPGSLAAWLLQHSERVCYRHFYEIANKARESTLLKNNRIEVVPNPIDTELFKPTEKKEAKVQLRLPMDKLIITFIAQNPADKRKGIRYLNEALIHLAKEYPKWINNILVMIIGNNKPMENLPFNTHLTGYIFSEKVMANYYNASDLFVIPSLEENLPNTIMESLSCGTPVVAFNTGGIPDMIDHQENGYLAQYKSAKDLANGIKWVLDDEQIYKKLSTNSRNKVLRNYTYEIIGKKIANLYQDVLNSPS